MKIVQHASEMGPFPHPSRLLALFAYFGYWAATGAEWFFGKLSSYAWRLRWRLGYVMFERCDVCDRHYSECPCELLFPYTADVRLHVPGEIDGHRFLQGAWLRVKFSRRADLHRWGESNRFHSVGVMETLARDTKFLRKARRLLGALRRARTERKPR